jgi:hypothetical protein
MGTLRFKGPKAGTAVNLSNITVGANSGSANVSSWKLPGVASGLPVIAGLPREGQTLTCNTVGLTSITGYQWKSNGTNIGGASSSTYVVATQDENYITCEVTCAQGVLLTPPLMIYKPCPAGCINSTHDTDDNSVLTAIAHNLATHIAVANGDWSAPATWLGGKVPGYGAFVLIPYGKTVTYDVAPNAPRLDQMRIDGELTFATDQNTQLFLETLVVGRGGILRIATAGARLDPTLTAEIVLADGDYATDNRGPTDVSISRHTRLWGRSLIWMGTFSAWGHKRTRWLRTAIASAPLATATSATLSETPVGWRVGDQILISGTRPRTSLVDSQTEFRTISSISGNVVSWTTGLAFDHNHSRNATVLRDDLQPVVGNITSNIIIRSRYDHPKPRHYLRPHTMAMHTDSVTDVWDVEFKNLGRTRKEDRVAAGLIHTNGNFRYFNQGEGGAGEFVEETLTARSNLQRMYPVHSHFTGFLKPQRDVYSSCVVNGSPGWGMSHHASEVDMDFNIVTNFAGAGMVAESGNETGSWVQNCCVRPAINVSDTANVKLSQEGHGNNGDAFQEGIGFAFVGRALRNNRNYAADLNVGFGFYHRGPRISHKRTEIDMKDLSGHSWQNTPTEYPVQDFPIIHFEGNEASGVVGGFSVTKSSPTQNHALNIVLKNFKVWDWSSTAGSIEYVGQYKLEHWDMVASSSFLPGAGNALNFSQNALQIALARSRSERATTGLTLSDNTAEGFDHNSFDTTNRPRYIVEAFESFGDTTAVVVDGTDKSKQYTAEQTYIEPDHNATFSVGSWNGSSITHTYTSGSPANITDTVSSGETIPKVMDGIGMSLPGSSNITNFLTANGYWTYSGNNIALFPVYISDRLSGRPVKKWHAMTLTGSLTGYTNNGAFTLGGPAPTVSAAVINTPVNTVGTLDVLALASGVGTLSLADSYYQPDHGRLEVNQPTAGDVRYTPDPGYRGQDLAWLWVDNAQGFSTRVDLIINVGITTAQVFGTSDWSVVDSATANSVNLRIINPPDAGGRQIEKIEYTTDAGATWRRYCWGLRVGTLVIGTASDGTTLTTGTFDFALRYKCKIDGTVVAPSASKSVTIS